MKVAPIIAAVFAWSCCLVPTVEAQGLPAGMVGAPLVVASYHHVGLVVANLAAEKTWYREAFGLVEVAAHQPTPSIRTALLRAPNGLSLELLQSAGSVRDHHFKNALEAASVQGYGHWALEVLDVDSAFKALTGAGATVGMPPAAGPGGARFAYVKDPEGNLIELIQAAPSR